MQDFKNKLKKIIPLSLAGSLLLHLGFMSVVYVASETSFEIKPAPENIEVVMLDSEEVQALKEKKRNPDKKNLPKEKLKEQLVQQEKQLNEEKPQDTRFLSKFNQRVIEETVADASGKFKNSAKNEKKQRGQKNAKAKPRKKSSNFTDGNLPTLADLTPKADYAAMKGNEGKDLEKGNGEESQTNDYLKDVEKGPQTVLNSREFKYYAYYQRIREKIHYFWEPKIRAKVKKVINSGRSVASARDRITKVIIILNDKGMLQNVQVVSPSGISDLDDAAVEAFRAAEPFPNPPNGIVEADGKVRVRWDFVLEV